MVECKRFRLEASDEQVLKYLLTHKVADRYEMSKELRKVKSYSSVFNAVKKLQKRKLVEVADSKKPQKNPKIKIEQYGLTLLGLVLACAWVLDWSEVNKVAEAHQDDLPLVFGKWKHFMKHGKEQDVVDRLHDAIDVRAIRLLTMKNYRTVESEATKEWCRRMRAKGYPSFMDIEYWVTRDCLMRDYTIAQVLGATPETVEEKHNRLRKASEEWRDVCLEDFEIKKFCKSIVENLIKSHKDNIEHLRKWTL